MSIGLNFDFLYTGKTMSSCSTLPSAPNYVEEQPPAYSEPEVREIVIEPKPVRNHVRKPKRKIKHVDNKTLSGQLIWIMLTGVAVICTYTVVNIELVKQRDECFADVIDEKINVFVVGLNCTAITYRAGSFNCTLPSVDCQYPLVGSQAVIYRSQTGRCGAEHNSRTYCANDLVLFNLLYTLFGVITTGLIIGGLLTPCFGVKLWG